MIYKIVATFEFADKAELALRRIREEFPNIKKADLKGYDKEESNRKVLFSIATSGYNVSGNNTGYGSSNTNAPFIYYDDDEIPHNEAELKQECSVDIICERDEMKKIRGMLVNDGGYDFIEVIDSTKS
jgi:hypothetical protein